MHRGHVKVGKNVATRGETPKGKTGRKKPGTMGRAEKMQKKTLRQCCGQEASRYTHGGDKKRREDGGGSS